MKRRPLIIIFLLLLLPLALLTWLAATESGLRWAYQQAGPYLPYGIKINKLQGRLIGPMTLENFEFHQDGVIIKADQIIFDWQPAELPAANVNISSLRIQSLSVVLPEAEQSGQVLSLPDISLPWRTTLKDGQIDGLIISRNDETIKLRQIRFKASALLSKVDIKELSVSADSFNLNMKGKLQPTHSYRHDLEINWSLKLPSGAMIDGNGQVAGDVQITRLKQQLRGPLQLTLDAELRDLLDQLKWQTRIDVKAFKAAQLDKRLPALSGALHLNASGDLTTAALSGTLDDAVDSEHPEFGTFNAGFQLQRLSDNSVRIDGLTLHSPGSGTRIGSHGLWTPGDDGGRLELALDWQNLRWPMQGPAWFNSASGSGSVEGTVGSYKIKLSSDSPWPELLPSTWSVTAEGNLDGLSIRSLRVAALGGEATATGRLKWSPELSWQIKVGATDINPAVLWPEWPGRLKADLASTGRIENGRFIVKTDITRLTGQLRSYPVSLQSSLIWRDNGLDIAMLDLHSGKSRVKAKGRIGETVKLDWAIDSDNLAELYPQAKGQLHAEGHLAGPRDAPTIQATFKGEALEMPGYRIGSIDGEMSLDLFQWRQFDINIAAHMLDIGAYSWQSLSLSSAGQGIEINAASEKLTALIKLQGIRNAQGWRGRIEQLELSSRKFYNWQLKAPAGLDISENDIEAQPICLLSKDSEVCMELQRQGDIWQARLDASQIPLMLMAPWLPADMKIEGKADAGAELKFQSPDRLLGQGRIELQPGAVSYPLLEGERDLWEYHGGTVVFAMNEQGINANAGITISNGDRLHFKADLPGANILALDYQQQSLRAEADMSVHDLGLIEAFLPEVQDLKGEIVLKLAAAGTLAQPRPGGDVHLLNGSLRMPRLGLTITHLSLSGQSHDSEKFEFRLDAHSGEGKLTIRGQTMLNSDKGWPTTISVKGSDFEVSRIPEARILVTPDLQIEQKSRKIKIGGNIHIPYAKLQPKDISTAARVSEDAVIIGSEKPTEEKWLLDTRIRLTLGERVHFYGFGFEGRLEGSLLLEDEPGHLTKATGEISIHEGRYRAYGQRLDIELGRLLYTGGSLTNPGLDLRAVRHVGNISAGLKVRGSLDKPQLELFSSPAMGQTDALAYLMLGGPIDKASGEEGAMMAQAALAMGLGSGDHLARTIEDRFGLDAMRVESSDTGKQASLVVGRYLSPRLYVSYGVGLIEAFNTLTLRYKITDKWQIKAESGESQGADILYTIER